MIHLVQLSNGSSRRVAVVEGPRLCCLREVQSVYELVQRCLNQNRQLSDEALALAHGESLDYDEIYAGTSEWRLLAPIDVPGAPSRLMIAGTGLTHLGSAKERQAMHLDTVKAAETVTDSMRMFQWGLEGGRPTPGQIGIAPEWFYKGTGFMLQPPFAPLTIPAYGEDGGEEAELAGIYIVGDDGTPYRMGMATGNEFSDHQFERRNYLNLAARSFALVVLGLNSLSARTFGQSAARFVSSAKERQSGQNWLRQAKKTCVIVSPTSSIITSNLKDTVSPAMCTCISSALIR